MPLLILVGGQAEPRIDGAVTGLILFQPFLGTPHNFQMQSTFTMPPIETDEDVHHDICCDRAGYREMGRGSCIRLVGSKY